MYKRQEQRRTDADWAAFCEAVSRADKRHDEAIANWKRCLTAAEEERSCPEDLEGEHRLREEEWLADGKQGAAAEAERQEAAAEAAAEAERQEAHHRKMMAGLRSIALLLVAFLAVKLQPGAAANVLACVSYAVAAFVFFPPYDSYYEP